MSALALIYSLAELQAQLVVIDAAIATNNLRPAQQSIDGNFVSFQAKGPELMAQRQQILDAIEARRRLDAGGSATQGPRSQI